MRFLKEYALARLFVAMAAGCLAGAFAPECVIRALNSFGATFAAFIKFIVPLIIVALVTPAIAAAGRGARSLLLATLALAYASTLAAGAFAFGVADALFPRILGGSLLAAHGAVREFPAYFTLAMPPVFGVVTAMGLAFTFGLAMAAVKCETLERMFAEMKEVVSLVLAKALVPLLPAYIFTVVADLAARRVLAQTGAESLKLAVVAIVVTVSLLLVQYTLAGIVARRNPLKALATMSRAYFTGLGCCSSAATIPVTLKCMAANGVSDETANLVAPLCANIHLAGSMAKITIFSAGFVVLAGGEISAAAFAEYILMLSVLAVAAPGVPGGMVLAAAPIAESVLGLAPSHYAVLIAAYLSIDGVGTACNLTGDGAIALIVDQIRARALPGR